MLSHPSEWMMNSVARYPPGPVLVQLTAATPGVRPALHRTSALTEQLTDEVLDLALEPLLVLYPQNHIPPAGTSNRLGRLGLQRRVEAAHPGGMVEQWLTLHNPSTAQGHWYLHQLLFLPRPAPVAPPAEPVPQRTQSAWARRAFRSRPRPPSRPTRAWRHCSRAPCSTRPPRFSKEEQQRGQSLAGPHKLPVVAWTAACRHLARDNTRIRQYRPADRTALASTFAAVTMGPVAAWPAQLLPHVPSHDTQSRQPAATQTPTAPLTAEELYPVAAALLADGRESFVHHHGPAQIAGSIQGPQRNAPHPWHATVRKRTRVRDAGGGTPPPRPQQGEALVLQAAGYQAILHGHAGGYWSHILARGCLTVLHGTARQGALPPHVDWRQEPTQAYYMTADPWPLAVLLHTISAPNRRQEPGW